MVGMSRLTHVIFESDHTFSELLLRFACVLYKVSENSEGDDLKEMHLLVEFQLVLLTLLVVHL